MAPNYIKAKHGHKFVLTAAGAEIGRIRAKFELQQDRTTRYDYCVPEAWLNKGYVKEIKENEVK